MADDDAVGLDVGDRWQLALVERREEIDRILDVGGALRRIVHDRFGVRERVADVAVVRGPQDVERIGRAVGDSNGCVEAAAVIRAGNPLVVERVADRAQARRWHLFACFDRGRIDAAVGQEARAHIVDHVERAR